MKTLQELFTDIESISDFNDIVMTYLSGDEDYISESLWYQGDITFNPNKYMDRLCSKGYTNDNFPWPEFRKYCAKVIEHLKENLIYPLP